MGIYGHVTRSYSYLARVLMRSWLCIATMQLKLSYHLIETQLEHVCRLLHKSKLKTRK